MAKSFAKEDTSAFNDDIIKEALKTGLTSIQASDDLISKTLLKCQNEIVQINEASKKSKSFSFMPLLYKVGAPLAAGALVLVLILNMNSPLMMDKQSVAAPEAVSYDAAAVGNDTMQRSSREENGEPAASASAALAPSLELSESMTATEKPEDGAKTKGFSGELADQYAYKLDVLNSSMNRTSNAQEVDEAESHEVFKAIVDQYNASNSTQLDLYEDGIIRIQTLAKSGVNAEMLLNSESFRDLLSGEGYWALPLKNSIGELQGLLAVNPVGKGGQDLAVTNLDLLVNVGNNDYIASAFPDITGSAVEILFDTHRLNALVKAQGYNEVKEISAVDINYGQDFLVFVEADGKELGIPLLRHEAALGLVNNSIYDRDELFRIISQYLN